MIDAVAAVAVVLGALLVALGGLGLMRFPDVFTRMHAATKAATVGVIGTTAAAAVEAGAASGILLLLLLIALLFLSGPLGMSSLARAAYHDPETPRSPHTRDLGPLSSAAGSTSPRRTGGTSPLLVIWLLLAWIALFGSVRSNVVLGGLIVATLVALALRRLAPRWPHAFLRPMAALRFIGYFVWRLLVSTWEVIRLLVVPKEELRPAVIKLPLRVKTRNEVALLMNAVSFTPGTVAMEIHHDLLYLHVLSPHPPRVVASEIDTMQWHIAVAFGGAAERHAYHATNDV